MVASRGHFLIRLTTQYNYKILIFVIKISMRRTLDYGSMKVLQEISAEIRSDSFLAKDDAQRSAYLEDMKKWHPYLAHHIDKDYLEILTDLNGYVVKQLRDVFSTKQFQVGNDLERQLMIDQVMKNPLVSEGPYRLPRTAVERVAAQQTVKSVGSPFNVMESIREVFRSQMFNQFSLQDKQRYIDVMLQQPSLIEARITRDDVMKARREIETNTEAIKRITADPFFLIMAKLDPKSLLRSCETNEQFRRFCQTTEDDKSALFSALMRIHYPDHYETNKPKEQYIAITMGLETYYWVSIEREITQITFGDPVKIGKTEVPYRITGFNLTIRDLSLLNFILGPGYVPPSLTPLLGLPQYKLQSYYIGKDIIVPSEEVKELYNAGKLTEEMIEQSMPPEYKADGDMDIVFKVKGYPIPVGTQAWLYIPHGSYDEKNYKPILFKTKEALAQYFVDNTYPMFVRSIVDVFFDQYPEYDEFAYNVHWKTDTDIIIKQIDELAPEWKFFLQRLGLPYPLNRVSLYQYILANDELRFVDQPEAQAWSFPKVTF